MKPTEAKSYFNKGQYSYLDFNEGKLEAQTDDDNPVTLDEKETKQLFLSMYIHYCAKGDNFWPEFK